MVLARVRQGETILKRLEEEVRTSRNHCNVPGDKPLGRIIFDSFRVPGTGQVPKKNLMSQYSG